MSVSVLTPSLNYGRFINDAIRSVAKQHYAVEHVVQDGKSTDQTIEILTGCSEDVDWVSEKDGGQSDALNRALSRASGDWIGWLNADEFYLPEALRRLLKAGMREDAALVYGDAVFVDSEGRFARLTPAHRPSPWVTRNYGMYVDTSSVLIRREAIESIGFDSSLRLLMDWKLLLSLERIRAKIVYVPAPIAAFRIHPDQVTASGRRPAWHLATPSRSGAPHEDEYALVVNEFHLPTGTGRQMTGRAAHVVLKLVDGCYGRQWRARRFVGQDFRWFDNPQARSNVETLQGAYCT